MNPSARILRVSGPLVEVECADAVAMHDLMGLGPRNIPGEVVAIRERQLTLQAYEYTGGLTPGDPALPQGAPLSARLGPGLLGGVFDGLLRPLTTAPTWLGAASYAASDVRHWHFTPTVQTDAQVTAGAVLGVVLGAGSVEHRVQVPPGATGTVESIAAAGSYPADAPLATVNGVAVSMSARWPVRLARPYRNRRYDAAPLHTGQRVVDLLFPIARGNTAAVPGGFGTGKTVLLQQVAKWCDADVIVYVGCGERGNEMAEVVAELLELTDPRTGGRLAERTVIIANTSNMPMMAREASVYTGVTVAEYYRDMGYHVVVVADSTSRWAEALREFTSRMGELPAEEGYPANLGLGAGCVLRTGWPRRHARRPNRVGYRDRRGVTAWRRPVRTGHRAHRAVRPLPLDPRPGSGLLPSLPGGVMVGVFLPRRRSLGRRVHCFR